MSHSSERTRQNRWSTTKAANETHFLKDTPAPGGKLYRLAQDRPVPVYADPRGDDLARVNWRLMDGENEGLFMTANTVIEAWPGWVRASCSKAS
ncbi:hypothetical protein [Cypionkella sp.]|uniref:hypothetical protein n=1 Tax=Cypionkella sp. TaxID=2811411 RepID=UPI002AC9DCB3|nr:hypothetical protein [Cypionkella sp.]